MMVVKAMRAKGWCFYYREIRKIMHHDGYTSFHNADREALVSFIINREDVVSFKVNNECRAVLHAALIAMGEAS
jgi:hypothetical protein